MKTYYMHMIEGKPAIFTGEQICHMTFFGPPNMLATSLKQIRKEQEATYKWRSEKGYIVYRHDYGHRRICVPDKEAQ